MLDGNAVAVYELMLSWCHVCQQVATLSLRLRHVGSPVNTKPLALAVTREDRVFLSLAKGGTSLAAEWVHRDRQ